MTHTRIGSCRKVAVVEGRRTLATAAFDRTRSAGAGVKVYLVTWKTTDDTERQQVRRYLLDHVCSELIE